MPLGLLTADYDFHLPAELIAQTPLARRPGAASRSPVRVGRARRVLPALPDRRRQIRGDGLTGWQAEARSRRRDRAWVHRRDPLGHRATHADRPAPRGHARRAGDRGAWPHPAAALPREWTSPRT